MSLKIVTLHSAPGYTCNTYVLGQEGEAALIIDPGNENPALLEKHLAKHHNAKVQGVFLTHGHFDHIGGLTPFLSRCPIFLSEFELPFLENPKYNLSYELTGEKKSFDGADSFYFVEDGDEFRFGETRIRILETPFHTPGSICLYLLEEKALLSGDTLFHLSIGRTDLPLGQSENVFPSLRKLLPLPPETVVYPGHGKRTTIENELKYNPYLQQAARTRD